MVFGPRWSTTARLLAVPLIPALAGLVVWRLIARIREANRQAGLATLLLVIAALAIPAGFGLFDGRANAWGLLGAVALFVLAGSLASSEWLRNSLRVFGVLALIALAVMTTRVGVMRKRTAMSGG